ncbi:MAG: hypothetical protein RR416_06575, partial [Clostridia bacterium]
MKKRYFIQQKPFVLLLAIAIIIIDLAGVIVNLLRLANVGALTSFNYPLDITITIALFAIAVVVPCFVFLPN